MIPLKKPLTDVYKRQGVDPDITPEAFYDAAVKTATVITRSKEEGGKEYTFHMTVSYTHLDVYKRQLNNLIQNAKNHVCDSGEIHLSVIRRESKLRFSIFNQGEQIPPQDIPMIWEKFYRGKSSQNNTFNSSGLGLSIVAQIPVSYTHLLQRTDAAPALLRYGIWDFLQKHPRRGNGSHDKNPCLLYTSS